MPMAVVPPFSVETAPSTQVIPAGSNPSEKLNVMVRSTEAHASGTVHPEIPQGWKVEPQSASVEFSKTGEQAAGFKILPDGAKEARYQVRALLNANNRDYSEGYSLVTRPDLGGFFYYQPAMQRASVVEVKIPHDLKIGYVMGAGDDIPVVLRQVGLDVTLLTADDIEHGDLTRFGTIVLGIRAYDTRDDVKKYNQRLLEFAQNGGTLVVQYNTSPSEFNAGHYLRFQRNSAAIASPWNKRRSPSSIRTARCSITPTRLRRAISTAGCRSVACTSWIVGLALHTASGLQRSRRIAAKGRAVAGAIWQGILPVHRVCVLPAVAVRRAWSYPPLREPAERGTWAQIVRLTSPN